MSNSMAESQMGGRILSADKVILSTGAGTAKLLADSAPERKDLQSDDRITAAAVVTGFVQLSSEQMQRFKSAPVFVHAVGEVQGRHASTFRKGRATDFQNRRGSCSKIRWSVKVLR